MIFPYWPVSGRRQGGVNRLWVSFAANVHFLVTDDKHFNVLKSIPFPAINIISLDTFKELLAD